MVGRQVILTNRPFTLEELHDFMKDHWDVNEAGEFVIGRPTQASIEEYILLPATQRFMTRDCCRLSRRERYSSVWLKWRA